MGTIHVAAGAIEDAGGRVLVTRRPDHVHQGGLWEFPGGKLERGESASRGLARELHEELGIRVRETVPLIRIGHDYGDRRVVLDVRRVQRYDGSPHGREGQPLRWVHPIAMAPEDFPAADRPVINALRLPQLFLVTGADPRDEDVFLGRLAGALSAGVRMVQLRAHGVGADAYARLARGASLLCERFGASLLLNRDPRSVRELPCNGLHLTGARLSALDARPAGDWTWIGASCHDAGDLARAARLGLDYAFLSPVLPTVSHPQARALGWGRFAALVDEAPLPVYALGGLGPEDVGTAVLHGAQGIAAIRGLWPRRGGRR
jgi:8-oxo-dGTP diphosphatase